MPNSARERDRETQGEREGCFCPPFLLDSHEASHQKRPQPKVLSHHYLPDTTIKNKQLSRVRNGLTLSFIVPERDTDGALGTLPCCVERHKALLVRQHTTALVNRATVPLYPPPVEPSYQKQANPVGHPQRLPTRQQGPPPLFGVPAHQWT